MQVGDSGVIPALGSSTSGFSSDDFARLFLKELEPASIGYKQSYKGLLVKTLDALASEQDPNWRSASAASEAQS